MGDRSPNRGRVAAAHVLHRIAEEGAWAAPALSAEFAKNEVEGRDRALCTELVYGTLRALPEVDEAFGAFLRAPVEQLEPFARAALRVGSYELLHLRAPTRAVVNEMVEIVARVRGKKLCGLVNAILRKVGAKRPEHPEPPSTLILPEWISAALARDLGKERAEAFVAARPLPPPIGLRVSRSVDRAAVVAQLSSARPGATVTLGQVAPNAILLRRGGDPRTLPGYAEGELAIQEQGAQVVGVLAGAMAGEKVADACAGRGGKTAQLAASVGPEGSVVALELHESKLERIAHELARLHLTTPLETCAVDLSVGVAGMEGRFDRVLVDAPCTGIGTLHRRPEILLRLTQEDPARMAELQLQILKNACRLARPGGTVVYAVCSPTREEGIGVIERLLAESGDSVALATEAQPHPTLRADEDGVVRIGPWDGDCDAYQVARLTVK